MYRFLYPASQPFTFLYFFHFLFLVFTLKLSSPSSSLLNLTRLISHFCYGFPSSSVPYSSYISAATIPRIVTPSGLTYSIYTAAGDGPGVHRVRSKGFFALTRQDFIRSSLPVNVSSPIGTRSELTLPAMRKSLRLHTCWIIERGNHQGCAIRCLYFPLKAPTSVVLIN